jgi:hypothetical protein
LILSSTNLQNQQRAEQQYRSSQVDHSRSQNVQNVQNIQNIQSQRQNVDQQVIDLHNKRNRFITHQQLLLETSSVKNINKWS